MAQPLPREHRGKEIWDSSRRQRDPPGTQERINSIQQQARREHTKDSSSSARKFSLRTDQKIRSENSPRFSTNGILSTNRQGCDILQGGCLGSAPKNCAKEKAGKGSNSGVRQKHPEMERAGMRSGGEMSQNHHATRKASMVLPGEVLQNHHTATKVGTSSSGGMCQQRGTTVEACMSLSGRLLQKNNRKEKMMLSQLQHCPQNIQKACIITKSEAPRGKKHTKGNTSFTGPRTSQPIGTKNSGQLSTNDVDSYAAPSSVTLHGSTTAQDSKEPAFSETLRDVEVNKDEEEADRAIQLLNEQGLGEDMSHEEYLSYLNKLPCHSTCVDRKTKLHGMELNKLELRLALHRFKYFKWLKKAPKNEPCDDKLKDDCFIEESLDCMEEGDSKLKEKCSLEFLEENIECFKEDECKLLGFLGEQEFFKRFEKDGTFDWFFHPDHCSLAYLDDYQRLVPKNFGGFEYVNWDEYRKYFHSYEIEKEYVQYCEELSDKLKWMEDYVLMKSSSRTWRRIFTRGSDQATKIAAGFSKITWSLASNGYLDFVENMTFDVCWYKELDGVYFEVWQRITKLKKSFRDALDEVYNLNKFPLRQPKMKRALETDRSKMEKEFWTCIEGISGEVTDDRAQELIAEAVKKLKERPKFYEHYIKKKIIIARVIGLVRD